MPVAAILALAAAGAPALAQEGNVLGPPQLRNYQIPGQRRTPPAEPQQVQPAPEETPPAAAPPISSEPAPRPTERAAVPRQRSAPDETRRVSAQPRDPQAMPSRPEDVFQLPAAPAPAAPPAQTSQPAAPPERTAMPFWIYLLPAGLVALLALMALRRRRRTAAEVATVAAETDRAAAPAPRPEPVPRPWLEIELKAERAAATETEAWVEFEMILHNDGKSPARNIRVNARMFNAGREQDKEIGSFFRTKGEGRKTHAIGELPPGERGLVQGTVNMAREEMKALQVNNQLLFIPVLAVNVVYDWGHGRSGQTSKSYVIGRELGRESDKMGAFRIDIGPRIYRTVGQRQHNLAKRL